MEDIKSFILSTNEGCAPPVVDEDTGVAVLGDVEVYIQDLDNLDQAARAAQMLAECFKQEGVREALSVHDTLPRSLMQLLATCVSQSHAQGQIQALRAIGNACYYHEGNRELFYAADGVQILATSMASAASDSASDLLRKVSAGVIGNVTGDHENFKKEFVEIGVMESLASLFESSDEQLFTMTMQALERFQDSEDALVRLVNPSVIQRLVAELQRLDDDVTAGDADDERVQSLSSLFRSICRLDATLSSFASLSLLQTLLRVSINAKLPPCAQVAAHTFAVCLSSDTCLDLVWDVSNEQECHDLLTSIVGWAGGDDHELQVASCVGIGNLCRTNDNARLIGQHEGAVACLLSLLDSRFSFVQYASICAVSNLAKLEDNRHLFRTPNALTLIIKCLNDAQPPIQYPACSVLRLAAQGQDKTFFCDLMEMDDSLIERLVHLAASEARAVQCEATRVLAAMIKFGQSSDVATPIIAAGALVPLLKISQDPNMLLQTEALVGLLVGSAGDNTCLQAYADHDVFTTVIQNAKSSTHPEIVCNTLSLLFQLLRDARFVTNTNMEALKELLLVTDTSEHELIADLSKQVRERAQL